MSPRTFGNEDRLPRVPLPSLDDSCTRFLRWCTPLLTAEQLAQTTAAVEAFRAADSPARALHAELERYNADPAVHSWLDDFWDTRYLGRRDRIALNANFFFLFADTTQRRLDRAVGLIAGALDYKLRLDAELVTPAVQRGAPLSMHQYRYLFGTTRIPHEVQDTARTPYSASEPGPSTARHIVVFHRGAIFRMDVFDPDGRPHAAEDLAAGLEELLKTAVPAEVSAGAFTTMARAEWAARRTVLLADPTNAAALETIETALFCLALDEDVYDNRTAACDQLLHGDSRDRWFDKAVTFIVFADGRAGINVEHCALDGTTILGFVDAVLAVSDEVRVERLGSVPQLSPVEFALDDASRSAAADAAADFAAYAAATATTTLSFPFGSSRAKELKISPDALVQLAYQLAHRRSKGFVGATYESISTRQFHHGRTEAMRVVTPEVLAFADAMENPELDAPARRRALRAAADAHVARAKDCQAGLAPEQHLWELQFIQRRKGAELGAAAPLTLYDTPGWTVTRDDYLSTSSAPSVNIQFFGFGMTSVRCIGVGYVLLPDRFNIYLSTPRQVGDQMHAFAEELVRAVDELQALLASPDA
ncbi:MAG: choline/carnitine O-acyltransferase [Mycobacteriaceae bacterium]|nr:choline/carnitine O-acyltransferase [Mycobacteriaceae bacterium]